jgi:hypothetical protein
MPLFPQNLPTRHPRDWWLRTLSQCACAQDRIKVLYASDEQSEILWCQMYSPISHVQGV